MAADCRDFAEVLDFSEIGGLLPYR